VRCHIYSVVNFRPVHTPAVCGGGHLDWWIGGKVQKRVTGIGDASDEGACFFVEKFGLGECSS
jgi:hypothetical protein